MSEAPYDATGSWQRLQQEVQAACESCGRAQGTVTIIGASKQHSTARLHEVYRAGLRVFGENRVQEALVKQAELPPQIDWHLIGPLQSNKARRAAEIFSTIHSVDRPKIAKALDKEAGRLGRILNVFLQVNLGGEPSKSGFACEQVVPEGLELLVLPNLRVRGLMAIPPVESDAARARNWFQLLADLRDQFASRCDEKEFAGELSMGMSNDFGLAIAEGATHVRVGTKLFGSRAVL